MNLFHPWLSQPLKLFCLLTQKKVCPETVTELYFSIFYSTFYRECHDAHESGTLKLPDSETNLVSQYNLTLLGNRHLSFLTLYRLETDLICPLTQNICNKKHDI